LIINTLDFSLSGFSLGDVNTIIAITMLPNITNHKFEPNNTAAWISNVGQVVTSPAIYCERIFHSTEKPASEQSKASLVFIINENTYYLLYSNT